MNETENTTTQNLQDTVKAVLKRKFIALQAHLKKQEKSQINNLTLHESWTIEKAEQQRIDAFELWCWIRRLRVPRATKRSN